MIKSLIIETKVGRIRTNLFEKTLKPITLVTLNKEMSDKLTIVNLPKVSLYFSYETLIALVHLWNNRKRLFMNSNYLNHSITTSKHLNKIKQLTNLKPIWKTEVQLNIILDIIFFL
ncbi:hypothetical protein LCGC14_0617580 [marine sediment metagenome]|uniref:DUF8033 domain-containing protein n=1 Tax=marine sediment metagenome TaxID=412755 RepID=A0A0F9TS38_9ZZZZ